MLNVGTEFRKGILFVRLKGHLNKDTINKLNKRVTKVVKENGIRTHVLRKLHEDENEIYDALRSGHIAYVINTRDEGSVGQASDGYVIRNFATENNVTIFTNLDTVNVVLDVLEETTLTISTIDA